MKIKKIDSVISINKFKNKEDFCNRLLQELSEIYKNNPTMEKANKKVVEITNRKNQLFNKNEKLDKLLEKSETMKKELASKINMLTETNNNYRTKLLEILETKQ